MLFDLFEAIHVSIAGIGAVEGSEGPRLANAWRRGLVYDALLAGHTCTKGNRVHG